MLTTGDWITPHFNGVPRFDKPILIYWLIALSYRVFGVTEFAARFWSALAAVALVVLLWLAGKRWFGSQAGFLAGLAFTTNLLTVLLARAAVTDMLLTLFVTTAILGGVEAMQVGPAQAGRWARATWVAMALAVLVKGPIGLVIPAVALLGSFLVFREVRAGIRRLLAWDGLALFAAITVPWYGLVLAANGWAFFEGFVIKHHVTRFTGVVSGHPGPVWFYLPVALVGFFPWSGFLPRALWAAARVGRGREVREPADRLLIACACWAAGVFLLFSIAGTKLPSYLFPAFPALAVLIGAAGGMQNVKPTTDNRPSAMKNEKRTTDNRSIQRSDGQLSVVSCPFYIGFQQVPRWLDRLGMWIIGVTGITLAAGLALLPRFWGVIQPMTRGVLDGVPPPVGLAWWLASLLAMGTAAAVIAAGAWRVLSLATTMALLLFTAEFAVAPRAYAMLQASLREFAQEAGRTLEPGTPVVTYGLNAPSIVFYAERRVIALGASPEGVEELRRMVESGRRVVVITRGIQSARLDQVRGLIRLGSRDGYVAYASTQKGEGPAGERAPNRSHETVPAEGR